MRVWITDSPYPTDDMVLAEAAKVGAGVVFHGVPVAYADVIPAGTLGVFDIPDPVPETPDIDPTHSVDDPIATEVAGLRAVVEALLADPEIAKVADIEAIRTKAEGSKDDDALILAVAKQLGADPAEVRKKRDADPQWFADVVAKYGLGSGKGDEVGAVKGK